MRSASGRRRTDGQARIRAVRAHEPRVRRPPVARVPGDAGAAPPLELPLLRMPLPEQRPSLHRPGGAPRRRSVAGPLDARRRRPRPPHLRGRRAPLPALVARHAGPSVRDLRSGLRSARGAASRALALRPARRGARVPLRAPARRLPPHPVRDRRQEPPRSPLSGPGARGTASADANQEDTVNLEDLVLVSVDDHVVEPPDMFERHVPAAYRDKAPRVVRTPAGDDVWQYEGILRPNVGLNAVAGRPPEEYGFEPTSYGQMRRGCFDVHERVRDMDANGVLASMCFGSFPSFCGLLWTRAADKATARVMQQAYNDWHVDEWCAAYPGRFLPLAQLPLWDIGLMAEEVRRVARKGCHA